MRKLFHGVTFLMVAVLIAGMGFPFIENPLPFRYDSQLGFTWNQNSKEKELQRSCELRCEQAEAITSVLLSTPDSEDIPEEKPLRLVRWGDM